MGDEEIICTSCEKPITDETCLYDPEYKNAVHIGPSKKPGQYEMACDGIYMIMAGKNPTMIVETSELIKQVEKPDNILKYKLRR